jgi:hypothetical protein
MSCGSGVHIDNTGGDFMRIKLGRRAVVAWRSYARSRSTDAITI